MGMPITVEIVGSSKASKIIKKIFDYFRYIDEKFSTYKKTSEISAINRGEIVRENFSEEMKEVFDLSEKTKQETAGFFNIKNLDGIYDPSGLVKGWAIFNASKIIREEGINDFYVEAGGDIEVGGKNALDKVWTVGIREPKKESDKIVKILTLSNIGIATSGTYLRGQHIYNPHNKNNLPITEIVSLTVIGPNVYEADRFATAGFAMGKAGINFIESLPGFEGYIIDKDGIATMTSGFDKYILKTKN